MKSLPLTGRSLAMAGVLLPLFALLIYVALRSGPLAPVPVTLTTVENRPLSPALFGIGTIEARHTYKIGPTASGRLLQVKVQVGDEVQAGELLGEMDPVDLDERIAAQRAALKRVEAAIVAAEAKVRDSAARFDYADTQARRYEVLSRSRTVSEDQVEAKHQEREVAAASLAVSRANLEVTRQELAQLRADHDALLKQRANLRLVAPAAGLVTRRNTDPGTTVVAGQAVIELIDPASLWINVRFDQIASAGLRAGLPTQIRLRSQAGQDLTGEVLRLEPMADPITEETLAKVVFADLPEPLPPIGELVEVTVTLPSLSPAPTLPSASIQRRDGRQGVWRINDAAPHFTPVRLGAADLDGQVQVQEGLEPGTQVVLYSERALTSHSRIKIVEQLPGS